MVEPELIAELGDPGLISEVRVWTAPVSGALYESVDELLNPEKLPRPKESKVLGEGGEIGGGNSF